MTIKSLDGLRGLAVLLVLLSHMSLVGMNLLPGLDFSGIGKAGVYLFFVLSAFLLTWQALEADQRPSPSYWLGYGLRRLCRIYPLYFIAVLASFGLTNYAPGYAPKIDAPIDVFQHLTLQAGEGIYWAIPVEFTYYLLLPLVTLVMVGCSHIHFTGPFIAAGLAIYAAFLTWPPADMVANSIGLGPYLAMFLLGSLTAFLCSKAAGINALTWNSRLIELTGWSTVIIALLTVPALAGSLFDSDIANNSFHRAFIFYGVIWSVAVVAAFHGGTHFGKFFALPACRFIGRVSFSVYLWHIVILQVVHQHVSVHPSVQFCLTIAVTFAISHLSYRWIERPCIRWGHQVSRQWMLRLG
ncbi:MAG: acyltransferase [Pseudomonadales bacterium]